ncbi:MAG: TolC family protein [Salinisphaera sp.]|jgi:outer membrane protein|nr:TolC family protein [Salinisphaera sp.]
MTRSIKAHRRVLSVGLIAVACLTASGLAVAAKPTPRPLSLAEAIHDALATNVQTLLARARKDEAAGRRVTARSAFLPHLSGVVGESRHRTNLAAQGFSFNSDVAGAGAAGGGIGLNFPTLITYNTFDARARLRQTLFDYSAWQDYKSAKIGEKAAGAEISVAREQVATQAELDYVAVLAARESVTAALADLHLAGQLLKLARDQEHVGVATGVDVTRARARQARAKATLAQRQTDVVRTEIQLARTVGLPMDTPLKLTDPLVFRPMPLPPAGPAIKEALAVRPEIALARIRIDQRQTQLASARGERLPTLSLGADYGASGNTPQRHDEDTYSVGAQLNIPIFDGGAIAGHIDTAASQLDQQRIRYRDTREQIEQDVRTSRQTMHTLSAQVRAARASLTLAKDELRRSSDRFQHGVADNLELVDAQSSLADARNTRINALAEYTRARINLAAALGRAQQFNLREPMTP